MDAVRSHPLLDFWNFLRRPVAERLNGDVRSRLMIVLFIVAVGILLSILIRPLSVLVEIVFKVEYVETTFDPLPVLLGGVLLVPLFEEVLFRLGLAPSIRLFFISLSLSTILYAPRPFTGVFGDELVDIIANVLFYLMLAVGICLFFWLRERRGYRYADFFNRHVGWYYYLSALFFGLVHLSNHDQQLPFWISPVMVIPQLIGGLTYGYLRIRLGFWYAVLGHMLHNFLFTCGDLFVFWFGELGGLIWIIVLIAGTVVVLAAPFWTGRLARPRSSMS
ncbi:CPBP family glutamic-type intramembrane protease [Chloroflexus aurantiacus]